MLKSHRSLLNQNTGLLLAGPDIRVAAWLFSSQNILKARPFRSRWNISCPPTTTTRSHESCCGQYVMCIFRREGGGSREAKARGGEGVKGRLDHQSAGTSRPSHTNTSSYHTAGLFHTVLNPRRRGSCFGWAQWHGYRVDDQSVSEGRNEHVISCQGCQGQKFFFLSMVCTALPDVTR